MYASSEEQTLLRTIISLLSDEREAEQKMDRRVQTAAALQYPFDTKRQDEFNFTLFNKFVVLEELLEEQTI